MCSRLQEKMENYQGDLTDILWAGGRGVGVGSGAPADEISVAMIAAADEWQFLPRTAKDFLQIDEETADKFGDPFSNMRDPLLQEMDMQGGSAFFASSSTSTSSDVIMRPSAFGGGGGGNTMLVSQGMTTATRDEEVITKRACSNSNNIFTRMLQISPNTKLPASPLDSSSSVVAPPLVTNETIGGGCSKGSMVENGVVQQQISSPRNSGMKRRKSQAKKVVCIPAPAPANSRPSGEIVPSDLWAWRKYGQKPIKGSPYPRGYYRCSSSKGCSARKQVERSRADPNMLVITYTSEHNHPWPTQRNALAGSTRTQPVKTGSTSKASQAQKPTDAKEEEKEIATDNSASLSPVIAPSSSRGPRVKEEIMDDQQVKRMGMDGDVQFNEGFQHSYKPTLPDQSNHTEDFFADLGELEADPLSLLFRQGYSGDEVPESKSLDPFTFYDYASNATASTITSTTITASSEELKNGS